MIAWAHNCLRHPFHPINIVLSDRTGPEPDQLCPAATRKGPEQAQFWHLRQCLWGRGVLTLHVSRGFSLTGVITTQSLLSVNRPRAGSLWHAAACCMSLTDRANKPAPFNEAFSTKNLQKKLEENKIICMAIQLCLRVTMELILYLNLKKKSLKVHEINPGHYVIKDHNALSLHIS